MRRRQVIAGLAALLAAPRRTIAETQRAPGRIGFLHPTTVAPNSPTVVVLRSAWEKLGYAEPGSIILRSAEGDRAKLPTLAAELVTNGAGVLIAVGSAALKAATELARVPVVAIDLETDPVRSGLAASFSRPGGNVTGLFVDQPSITGKWVELLREAVPGLERVALISEADAAAHQQEAAVAAARALGLTSITLEIGNADYESALAGLGGDLRTGVVRLSGPGFQAASFAETAVRRGLPTMSFLKTYARAGLLMTYGPSQEAYYPRAVVLADRILRGASPGDLPIEQPTTFEFVINLKTAKALGLTISPTLLARADEVIE
jgi:putative ABC transport system substrate-binding protein